MKNMEDRLNQAVPWRLLVITVSACALAAGMSGITYAKAPPSKVDVCHISDDDPTVAKIISISPKALPAFVAKGDLPMPAFEAQELCADGKDNDCDGTVDSADSGCTRQFSYVFTTSATYPGDLRSKDSNGLPTGDTGLMGADAKCNALADAAVSKNPGSVLKGHRNFTAWLSDGSTNAKDRVILGAGTEYRLVNGTTVVFEADLSPTTLYPYPLVPMNMDENGTTLPPGPNPVWTGTGPSGTRPSLQADGTARLCDNWIRGEASATGQAGDYSIAGKMLGWSDQFSALSCDKKARMYCFEDGGDAN